MREILEMRPMGPPVESDGRESFTIDLCGIVLSLTISHVNWNLATRLGAFQDQGRQIKSFWFLPRRRFDATRVNTGVNCH